MEDNIESDGPDTPGELELAMKRLEEIRAEIAELRTVRDNATKKINALLQDEAELVEKYQGTEESGHIANQKAIMEHLKRQQEAREIRAKARRDALATGATAEALRGMSALDAAHTRNTSRGTKRPNMGSKVA